MNNEPAFPFAWESPLTGKTTINNGMTLRDYFAAKAMQGFLDQLIKQGWHLDDLETVAETSYKMADAMMKARQT